MSQENLPNSVLYAISARIGGIGLDLVAHETIRGIEPFLGKAISYGVRAPDIDRRKMKTLRFHPVRLLSNLERKYYYAAKKRAVDRVAAQFLTRAALISSTSGPVPRCMAYEWQNHSGFPPSWRFRPGTGKKVKSFRRKWNTRLRWSMLPSHNVG